MKLRDYLFWASLSAVSLYMGPCQQLQPRVHAQPRQATWLEKTTWWLAMARIAHNGPRELPRQELPDTLVNAPPERLIGPDGHPLIDHGAGW